MEYFKAVLACFGLVYPCGFDVFEMFTQFCAVALPLVAAVLGGVYAGAYPVPAFTVIRSAAFGADYNVFIIKEFHAAGGTFFVFKLFVHFISLI